MHKELILLAMNNLINLLRIHMKKTMFTEDHLKDLTIMHVLIHKDNAGALILAKTLAP